ncbi:MAG: UvrB domain 3-containing protein [Dehalococcoidia bacterium]
MVTIDNKATEKDFEAVIERDLISLNKYKKIEPCEYSLEYNLVPNQVIEYVKKTQSKNWQKLSNAYGDDSKAEKQLLQRLNSELSKKGIIRILRNGIKVMSTDFYFLGFKPSMSLNPELNKRYENNFFGVMRQFRFNEKDKTQTIDMAIFLNGILVFSIELKNQLSGQNIEHSKEQYEERNNNTPSIKHKRVLAYFCSDTNNVAFTTKLNKVDTKWFPFNRGIENPATEGFATEYFWKDVLEKDSVLELIESFSFEDKSGNIIFPRYHQRDVVLELEDAIRKEKVGNRYLIQHSTGSGKSNSIAWLAHRLSSFYLNEGDSSPYFDSVLILTNRKVLDNQISDTVSYLSQQQGVVVRTDDKSSKQLMDALETKKKIVISTIQKFLYIHNKISEIKGNFAVIIDEVHDTYSGKAYTSSLNDTIIEKNYEDLKSIDDDSEEENPLDGEDYIVETLRSKAQPKNASYFGFTGTPKPRTIAMFAHNKQIISGEESNDSSKAFHSYTMKQSIHEGFTLDVLKNYTTYKTFFSFLQKNEDRLVDRNLATKAVMDMYRGNINIEQICEIISNHFIEHVESEINNEARAMIVTGSRVECVKYFRQINKRLEEKNADYRALVAFSPFTSEDPEITGKYGNNTKYDKIEITEEKENQFVGFTGKSIPQALKTKKFRILVIANKYQTGFDEPLLQTMYVIKTLRNEKAVQTLSRLNRIYPPFKDKTFVLDFVNTSENIKEAFQPYYGETVMHGDIDFDSIWTHYDGIMDEQFFSEKDVSEFYSKLLKESVKSEELNSILDKALKKIIAEDEKKHKRKRRNWNKRRF